MVDKKQINESIDYSVSVNKISNIIRDNIVIHDDSNLDLVQKCSENSATKAGEGAKVHMANDPDGVRVPLRHLQDKGYDENGNHMGYIADIEYPNGTRIDYVNGYIRDADGTVHQMGFDDNYKKDGQGNRVHDPKGSANELFKPQWQAMNDSDKRHFVGVADLVKRPSLTNTVRRMVKDGINLERRSTIENANVRSPLGKLLLHHRRMLNGSLDGDWTRVDGRDIVVGEQVAKSDISYRELHTINTVNDKMMTETSVGFLNDKSLNVRNDITGEVRSVNGKVNNWDNTYKVYTLIGQGSGAKGVYMGYPQNVKAGAWDNSGNPMNELDLLPNQHFEKVLVDKTNGVVIQKIVSD